ncbi:MAG: putative NADPH-quinone reductase [Alphaproteobacteria bacterium]
MVAKQHFSLMRDQSEFKTGEPAPDIKAAQEAIFQANHIVLIYPLWLGTMPAVLKGFFEQVLRPDFSFDYLPSGQTRPRLKGRSCRIVITMGMPALVYRWFFGAHSLKSLERNILKFVGFGPIRESLFGMVDAASSEKRTHWIAQMRALGRKAS